MSTDFRATAGGDGIVLADSAVIGGSTLSGAELAFVDGVTAGTVTASKAVVVDSNKHIDTIVIADGGLKLGATTGTAVTSTAAELNFLDGSVAGTAVASKAAVLGTNKNLDVLAVADGGLSLGAGAGTAITSTAAELNFLDGSVAGTAVASKAAVLGTNKNLDVLAIADGGLSLGAGAGTAITSTAAELNILDGATVTTAEVNQYSVSIQMTDAGTAQSIWVVAPHAGSIVAAYVVNSVANATTKTVFTLEIETVLVTMPALEVAITQAAGTVSSAVPTATNVVTAGQAIEVISDGGTDATMPVTVTLVISR